MRDLFALSGGLLLYIMLMMPSAAGAENAAAPLRVLHGKWVDVVTDLPPDPETDALTESFDAAVAQWLRYWGADEDRLEGWHVTAHVMKDRDLFRRRGLLPDSVPEFPHGYALGQTVWVVAQDSDYYTRHLVLHEGVHAFAFHVFGGAGPFWFMEGTAEWLATHHEVGRALQLPVIPRSREATPLWGRLKLIAARRDAGRWPSIQSVMRYPNQLVDDVERYAWSWAAVVLLNMYPEYRRVLIETAERGEDASPQFTRTLYKQLYDQWPVLRTRWRLLVDELDYGYDLQQNRVDLDSQSPLWETSAGGSQENLTMQVAADRGWQSAAVRVSAGTKLHLTATGRYTLGNEPAPWVSEPQGVTVRYHRGRPLGMLLATVVPTDPAAAAVVQPLEIVPIGREGTVEVDEESWLLLQIGDSPAERTDNAGHATVRIERQ